MGWTSILRDIGTNIESGRDRVHGQAQGSRTTTLRQVWATYTKDRGLTHRNELIVAYQPLVTSTVQRLPAYILSYWEPDELRSFGQDGLMRAIVRWNDPDISKFEQYAQRCIRGAVFDELRRLDWMPRSVRQRVIAYKTTHDFMTEQLGRTPTQEEVCLAMGLSPRQARELMGALNASQILHLEGRPGHSIRQKTIVDVLADESAGPETTLIELTEVESLYEAASLLADREYKVLLLAFFGDLTQDQIGKIIGVSGPQVCKIQSAALRKLRAMLESHGGRKLAAVRNEKMSPHHGSATMQNGPMQNRPIRHHLSIDPSLTRPRSTDH